MYLVPAVKDKTQVSRGRGVGGLATIWKKSLTKYVTKLDSKNPRVQASMFNFPQCPIVVVNTYFPCDPRSSNSDLKELHNLLNDIEEIIRDLNLSNIMLCGDLNCDFERENRFTITIADWIKNLNLNVL